MRYSGKVKYMDQPYTILNTEQAHSKQEWVSVHYDFSYDLGEIKEYVDLNIKVSLAKDYE